MQAVIVFFCYVAIDALYALYVLAVANKERFKAASVGAGMHFLMAFGVLSLVQSGWYLIPIAAGSWVGTYLYLWYEDA